MHSGTFRFDSQPFDMKRLKKLGQYFNNKTYLNYLRMRDLIHSQHSKRPDIIYFDNIRKRLFNLFRQNLSYYYNM